MFVCVCVFGGWGQGDDKSLLDAYYRLHNSSLENRRRS